METNKTPKDIPLEGEIKYIAPLKVGDIVYWTGDIATANFHVDRCEIRKVEESRSRPGEFTYYIRYVNFDGRKCSKQTPYTLWPDRGLYHIYRTPEEAMQANITRYRRNVVHDMEEFAKATKKWGIQLPPSALIQLPQNT